MRSIFLTNKVSQGSAAMAAMGFCEDYLRLPLTPMEDKNRARLLAAMRDNGINV